MKFDPIEPITHNPMSEIIPMYVSITKSHHDRISKRRCKGNGGKTTPEADARRAEKNSKPIKLIFPDGTIREFKGRGLACLKIGYKNPSGSPLNVAIRKHGKTLPDGSIEVPLMGKKYIILEM